MDRKDVQLTRCQFRCISIWTRWNICSLSFTSRVQLVQMLRTTSAVIHQRRNAHIHHIITELFYDLVQQLNQLNG